MVSGSFVVCFLFVCFFMVVTRFFFQSNCRLATEQARRSTNWNDRPRPKRTRATTWARATVRVASAASSPAANPIRASFPRATTNFGYNYWKLCEFYRVGHHLRQSICLFFYLVGLCSYLVLLFYLIGYGFA